MDKLRDILGDDEKRLYLFAGIGAVALIVSLVLTEALGMDPAVDPAWAATVLCGWPILKGAVVGLVRSFDIKADVLVAMAILASISIGETFAAGEVAFIMTLGGLLEERTVRKSHEGIQKLVDMTPRTARVIRRGAEVTIPASEVAVGDVVRVNPGETIPVDGEIVLGSTAIDQSLVTGESLPVDRQEGDEVFSGTVNQQGSIDIRATRADTDSSIQRMVRLVETADANKTPIVRIMDRWATWLVVISFATALAVWAVTGEFIRAVTVLVVFCPCGLVLATPTAVMAGIGNATRFGVLVAQGDTLERLSQVRRITFDKTGTLTYGRPEVVAAVSFADDVSETQLLQCAATVEQRSEHPLGKAVMRFAKERGVSPSDAARYEVVPGRGVVATVGAHTLAGGTLQFMKDRGSVPSGALLAEVDRYRNQGCTVIFIGAGDRVLGIVALSDTLRPDAGDVVRKLHDISVPVTLLTGDNAQAARTVASSAGIEDVRAELLPEGKVDAIRDMMQRGEKVCMVGDGMNDAPALKTAHVGIAMGGVGSDIAVDAADAVLVKDDITRLPHLVMLARRTAWTITVGIAISMILNFVNVTLAALGLIGPVIGALCHNVGSLIVVANSARLLKWEPKK